MAGEVNKELSRQLSYKLQDAVLTGSEEGTRFPSAARLLYIQRAHRKLLRLLKMLYPKLVAIIFKDYYKYETLASDDGGIVVPSVEYYEVLEIYAKPDIAQENWLKAFPISQEDWLAVKTGQSDFYKPDLNREDIYQCVFNGRIELAPEVLYPKVLISYVGKFSVPSYTANDININDMYYDILLNLAAGEAYLDLGENERATMFTNQTTNDLNVLVGVTQKKESKDEA